MIQPNHYIVFIGLIFGFILLFRFPRIKDNKNINSDNILVSIIIPARNEEKNLPNILDDIKRQNIKVHETICVDDNSQDATASIIDKFHAKKVSLSSLPKGWKGKTWACQNGAEAATGDLLLFLDADVRLSENAVNKLVWQYKKNDNPISIQPMHIVKKQYEYFSLFFNLIQICATGLTLIFNRKYMGFFGPVLMIQRDLFNKHGGYEKVKNKVVEDFSLGKIYSKSGINIDLFLGGNDISFKMYPSGVSSLIEGWSKNFSSASFSTKWWLLVIVIIWIASLTALPIEIIKAILENNLFSIYLFISLYLLTVLNIARAARKIGTYPFVNLLFYPIYLLGFHLIYLYSLFATFVFKSTTWKGRKL
jgi:4,4'-diaponeurosporenoate glycosyltransferase